MMSKYLVGIEIGGTKLQIVLTDDTGCIHKHLRLKVKQELGANGILQQIGNILQEWKNHHVALDGIGIGFGGPVDTASGVVLCSHQIQGWDGVSLKGWANQIYPGVRVAVENDSNTATLAEATRGAGKGFSPLLYMNMGSGIGGGLVVNGKLYHGIAPGEIEIGHIRLNKAGDTLESQCSGWGVDRKILAAIKEDPSSLLAECCRELNLLEVDHGQALALIPAIEKGDIGAKNILEETADNLAFGLSHAVHLVHPQAIVLGGGLALMGALLLTPIERNLPKYLMKAFLPAPKVYGAKLGELTVPLGAVALLD